MVSHLLRGDEIGSQLRQKMIAIPTNRFGISTLTEAELLYGLAKKPEATKLRTTVYKFLADCDILSWDSAAARSYADLRAKSESNGISADSFDILIAAHAYATGRTLITRDSGLLRLKPWVFVEKWTD
jgi:tRNA(fMet)-specific endonuclease VapC